MVNLNTRNISGGVDYKVSDDMMKLWIDADWRPIANVVRSTLREGVITLRENFQTEVRRTVNYVDGGKGMILRMEQYFGGTLSDEFRRGRLRGALIMNVFPHSGGTQVKIINNTMEEDKTLSNNTNRLSHANETENITYPIEYIVNNPEKAVLGYGPTHPLEGIEPVTYEKDVGELDRETVISDLDNWIREAIRRTTYQQGEIGKNEHGFYVDGADNVVGIIEGGRKSIAYPPRDNSGVKVQFHTHPRLESVAIPSKEDLLSATVTPDQALHLVSKGVYHSQLTFDESEKEKLMKEYGVEREEINYRPKIRVPIVSYRYVDADRGDDIEDYIDEYYSWVRENVSRSKKFIIEDLEKVGLEEQRMQIVMRKVDKTTDIVIRKTKNGNLDAEEAIRKTYEESGTLPKFGTEWITMKQW